MTDERPKCAAPGCNNVRRNKGRDDKGNQRYGLYCCTCHRQRAATSSRYSIENAACQVCGWDKAPCDRHRVDPKKGYRKRNVAVLCPNCHRLVTLGKLALEAIA